MLKCPVEDALLGHKTLRANEQSGQRGKVGPFPVKLHSQFSRQSLILLATCENLQRCRTSSSLPRSRTIFGSSSRFWPLVRAYNDARRLTLSPTYHKVLMRLSSIFFSFSLSFTAPSHLSAAYFINSGGEKKDLTSDGLIIRYSPCSLVLYTENYLTEEYIFGIVLKLIL